MHSWRFRIRASLRRRILMVPRRDLPVVPLGSCAERPVAITLNGSRLTLAYICNWLPRSGCLASISVAPRSQNSRRTRDHPVRVPIIDPPPSILPRVMEHTLAHRPSRSDLVDPTISEEEPCRGPGQMFAEPFPPPPPPPPPPLAYEHQRVPGECRPPRGSRVQA